MNSDILQLGPFLTQAPSHFIIPAMMDFSEDGLYLENSMFLQDQILLIFFFFWPLYLIEG